MSSSDKDDFVYVPAKPKKPCTPDAHRALVRRSGNYDPVQREAQLRNASHAIVSQFPEVTPSDEDQETFNRLCQDVIQCDKLTQDKKPSLVPASSQEAENSQLPGVELGDASRACACNVVVFLGHLGRGTPWRKSLEASGMSFLSVELLKKLDADGFGRLLAAAEAAKAGIERFEMREALHQRAVNGVDDVVIGRIDKDKDGVVTDAAGKPIVKRKYSDRLLEFALSKLDKETFGDVSGTQNIGQQVIYNIKGINLGQQVVVDSGSPTGEAKDQKSGGKPAAIDLDSLGNLE
jgi:hypothetical protein